MARKRLTKGANALRVEERIALVPLDVVRPAEGETGIFKALRALERDDGPVPEPRRRPRAAAKGAAAKRAAAKPTPAAAAPARRAISGGEDSARLGPLSFSDAERGAIVVCCTEYRNRLPTYLLSAKKEVEIIDSILKKCERARGASKGGSRDGAGPSGPRRG
jgi:hypothetical protein